MAKFGTEDVYVVGLYKINALRDGDGRLLGTEICKHTEMSSQTSSFRDKKWAEPITLPLQELVHLRDTFTEILNEGAE